MKPPLDFVACGQLNQRDFGLLEDPGFDYFILLHGILPELIFIRNEIEKQFSCTTTIQEVGWDINGAVRWALSIFTDRKAAIQIQIRYSS
jgi:hypothetical protein